MMGSRGPRVLGSEREVELPWKRRQPPQPKEIAVSTPLRVLILEDRPADARLVLHELRQAGFDPEGTRVEDETGFLAHLSPPPDLICADYVLPQFDALRALRLVLDRGLDVPFIIVSGSIGEDLAVAAMKQGATDYLLKDRLARLGEAVRHALKQKQVRDEKRRLEQGLRDHLTMLAHELRNPLAPLLMSIEVARRGGPDPQPREQALDTAARSVRQLARLVDDLLEATRVTRGQIRVRPKRMDLARLARVAAADRRPLFDQASLTLTVAAPETPIWVRGDEIRLAQVLHNLLDNAVRFTERGGSVGLTVGTEGPEAVVALRDTGAGITPDLLPRVFEPFSQADQSLDRSRGGLGLGLSVVKGLVELHGGRVLAFSEGPGRGAEFTVRLPLEPEPAAWSGPHPPGQPGGRRRRILVIEDSRDTAESLRLLLQMLGHEVRVAHTGPEGVRAAREWKPELVLCDIGLPGLDGYGVARELRSDPATARAHLLALTGYGGEEDRRRSREAGFDHHLIKPVAAEDLLEILAGAEARG
ncbi:MAG: response regulator [Planctomycetes bacterium]|nr:response regulator [Planctomycetota bacterium]